MGERFDVVVVGAGHNGLVCAFYLARAGLDVCVLERCDKVGGAVITEEFYPGFRNSTASYTVSLLQPRIIAEMGLARQGLRIVPRPLANFIPSLDGPGLELHGTLEASQAAIHRHSPRDAKRFPGFRAELGVIAELLRSTLLEPPLDFSAGWREWLRAVSFLPRFKRLASPGRLSALRRALAGSAGNWLDRWFDTDLLKGGLAFDAVVGHYASPYTPGSGYLLLHHALGEVDGKPGMWGHAMGGMGAITQAMAEAVRAQGGRIRLESAVEGIRVSGGHLEVHTACGSVLAARAVAGAIHPQVLLTRLVEPEELPVAFLDRLRGWRSESATFRMNVALSELPDFTCLPGRNAAPHHGAGILISPSLGYLDRAYEEARVGGYSGAPVVELLIPSTVDPSLAPPGAHVASLFCQHFPRHLPDGRTWREAKDAAAATVIRAVARYAPNFERSILGVQALSPEDLERRFGLVGGDIFHGQMTLDQLYWARPARGYARYRTPLRGLYLCGSGAHPGGGVTGAPGHNAARAILEDLLTP